MRYSAWLEKSPYGLYFGEGFGNAAARPARQPVKLVNPGVLR
jgi:hypothetical protein